MAQATMEANGSANGNGLPATVSNDSIPDLLTPKQKEKKKASKSQQEKERKKQKKQEAENKALAEFKLRLKDRKRPKYHDDDASLVRFLRARKCDVDKAYHLYDDCLKWRASYKPEEITLDQIPREANAGKAFFLGKDKQGRPCWLILPARHEPKNSDNEECVRALIYYVEQALAMMENGVEQVSLIVDFDGWGLKNVDHDLDKMMIDTIQNYYPERLGCCYLVNAPTVFKFAWTVVRPWLDKRTTSKITFLGSSETTLELLKVCDENILPTKYGGKNTVDISKGKSTPKGPPKGISMSK